MCIRDSLDGGDLVFVHHIGDAPQFLGAGLAAPHARDHAVAAVLLDVGVAAFVDEAALRVVLRLLRPGADEVVVDGRAAGGAAVGRAPVEPAVDAVNGLSLIHISEPTRPY